MVLSRETSGLCLSALRKKAADSHHSQKEIWEEEKQESCRAFQPTHPSHSQVLFSSLNSPSSTLKTVDVTAQCCCLMELITHTKRQEELLGDQKIINYQSPFPNANLTEFSGTTGLHTAPPSPTKLRAHCQSSGCIPSFPQLHSRHSLCQ